jgi:sulfotransferase family protein
MQRFDSHPEVECRKDAFSIRRRWKRFQVDVKTGLFYQYRSASLARQLDYLFRRRRLVRAFLDETLSPTDGVPARGIRLSYEQVRKYPDSLPWVLENDVRIIHLVRENALKAVVSHFTAKKRGFAHATSQVPKVTLRLPPAELKALLVQREREIDRYRVLFQGRPCCEVFYETFLAQKEEETRRLLDFLGISRYAPLTSRLVKQNPDSLRDILENYDEIARALRGTSFERHLET